MKNKALSPMIAVVLLIAFTIAIGGILSVWLSSYIPEEDHTVCEIWCVWNNMEYYGYRGDGRCTCRECVGFEYEEYNNTICGFREYWVEEN